MGYRRLFIIRKDLHLSTGKLLAQVGHCCEGYWLNQIRNAGEYDIDVDEYKVFLWVDKETFEEYIAGSITKTVCEARNKAHLLKSISMAKELGLEEGKDFGLIKDKCLTELTPEEDDGTTVTGVWFRPLDDETAHKISQKYHLYM